MHGTQSNTFYMGQVGDIYLLTHEDLWWNRKYGQDLKLKVRVSLGESFQLAILSEESPDFCSRVYHRLMKHGGI